MKVCRGGALKRERQKYSLLYKKSKGEGELSAKKEICREGPPGRKGILNGGEKTLLAEFLSSARRGGRKRIEDRERTTGRGKIRIGSESL